MSEESHQLNAEPDRPDLASALIIAREAVQRMNIPDVSTYYDERPNLRFYIYCEHTERDLALIVEVNAVISNSITKTSLVLVAWTIQEEVRRLLQDADARKFLFVEDDEIEQVIHDETLTILLGYITYFPMTLFHTEHQILKETLLDYLKKTIEPRLNNYASTQGLSNDIKLVQDNHLQTILDLFPKAYLPIITLLEQTDMEFTEYRKNITKDRKVWLTNVNLENLPNEYKNLSNQYKKAKAEYETFSKEFFRENRSATFEQRDEQWRKHCLGKFPELFFPEKVEDFEAFKLAQIQLADKYGYKPSYMERLITQAKEKGAKTPNEKAE